MSAETAVAPNFVWRERGLVHSTTIAVPEGRVPVGDPQHDVAALDVGRHVDVPAGLDRGAQLRHRQPGRTSHVDAPQQGDDHVHARILPRSPPGQPGRDQRAGGVGASDLGCSTGSSNSSFSLHLPKRK